MLILDNDLEFICFGGESEMKCFGYDFCCCLIMDLLLVFCDVEGDFVVWC